MRIINVVEIIKGVLTNIKSFVIDGEEDDNVVQKAECLFKELATANGCTDVDVALENGNWDDINGYEVVISWSEIMNPAGQMTLFQLKDCEGEDSGLVRTNAPEDVVQADWKRVNAGGDDYTDEEYRYMVDNNGGVNGYDPEELSMILEMKGYIVDRVWVTNITG